MFKSKFTIIGILIVIFALYMQFNKNFKNSNISQLPQSTSIPKIATEYIKDKNENIDPKLKIFNENDYQNLLKNIENLSKQFSMLSTKTLKDYKDDCINIFQFKITSSKEHEMIEKVKDIQNFKVILTSSDIEYSGYLNTNRGLNALIKVKKNDMCILSVGDNILNSNLKIQHINEKYIILENLIDGSKEKILMIVK